MLPDGRLIAIEGDTISVQDALHAPSYSVFGSVTPGNIGSFGASFLSVNPSGTRLAIGDGEAGSGPQDMLFFDVASLSTASPTVPELIPSTNNAGAWSDDDTLYVSGAANFGEPSMLTRIDVLTSSSTVVVDGLNGASGGVAVHGGRVFTGNGFGSGSGLDATGAVGSFDLASLEAASSPVAFSTGTLTATALSAFTLDFDNAGNLIVGGSDAFGGGEGGFVSVIGAGSLPGAVSADGQMLFPDAGAFGFPSAVFNDATGEVLVRDGDVIYRYAVPTPGALGLFLIVCAPRRRSRA